MMFFAETWTELLGYMIREIAWSSRDKNGTYICPSDKLYDLEHAMEDREKVQIFFDCLNKSLLNEMFYIITV